MPLPASVVNITESSQVFEARRLAIELGQSLGWAETAIGKLAIASTEAATNLIKHAQGGEIHLRTVADGGGEGIELLALDKGRGMTNIHASMADGFSTAGTAGSGLGAIRRLSTEFDIYSLPGKGAALMARFFPDAPAASTLSQAARLTLGAVHVPVKGETVSGDNWAVRTRGLIQLVLVADGLGHGPGAAEASTEAVRVFNETQDIDPVTILETIHLALRATRGAAVAIAKLDLGSREVRFAGVGNISAMLLNGGAAQHLVSYNGTAGQAIRKLQHFTYPWPSGALLAMHSDGLTTSWRLDSYPGLAARHPALIAGVLYRDASRGRDDACIVVAREIMRAQSDGQNEGW